jgi:hypothetical protein
MVPLGSVLRCCVPACCHTRSFHVRNCPAYLLQASKAAAHAANGTGEQAASGSSQQPTSSGNRQQPLTPLHLSSGAEAAAAAAIVSLGALLKGGIVPGQQQVPPQLHASLSGPGAATTTAAGAPAGVPQEVAARLAAAKTQVRGCGQTVRQQQKSMGTWQASLNTSSASSCAELCFAYAHGACVTCTVRICRYTTHPPMCGIARTHTQAHTQMHTQAHTVCGTPIPTHSPTRPPLCPPPCLHIRVRDRHSDR